MDAKDKELHRVAVTAIIYNDQNKFLITRRSLKKAHQPGRWTVPGGGFSTDDYTDTPKTHANAWYYSLTNALKREVKEEVNLEIDNCEYLLDLTYIHANGFPSLVISYFAKHISGEVMLDDDTIDFAWVTPDELSKYDLIEGIVEEIRMVDEILKKRKIG